jgi:hypothetical protein
MKILLLLLAMTVSASAQSFGTPSKIIRLYDKKTNETIGTVIVNGNNAILRDAKGEHIQTMSIDKNGVRTVYDPSGKVIKRAD